VQVGAFLVHTLELKQRYNNAKTAAVQALLNDLSSVGTTLSIGTNRWEIALKEGTWVQLVWHPDASALEITITDRELRPVDQLASTRARYEELLRRLTPRLQTFGATTVGATTATYAGQSSRMMIGLAPSSVMEELERLNDEVRSLSEKMNTQRAEVALAPTSGQPRRSPLDVFVQQRWSPFLSSWRRFYDDLKDTSSLVFAHRSKTIEKALSDWQGKLIDVRVDALQAGLRANGADSSQDWAQPPASSPIPNSSPIPGLPSTQQAATPPDVREKSSNVGLYAALGLGAVAVTAAAVMAFRTEAR